MLTDEQLREIDRRWSEVLFSDDEDAAKQAFEDIPTLCETVRELRDAASFVKEHAIMELEEWNEFYRMIGTADAPAE